MSDLLFYEDAPIGLSFETGGMVVTESHIVQFAGLSGDLFDLHMDDEFARSLGFSGRVAHGLLGLISDGRPQESSGPALRGRCVSILAMETSGGRCTRGIESTDG